MDEFEIKQKFLDNFFNKSGLNIKPMEKFPKLDNELRRLGYNPNDYGLYHLRMLEPELRTKVYNFYTIFEESNSTSSLIVAKLFDSKIPSSHFDKVKQKLKQKFFIKGENFIGEYKIVIIPKIDLELNNFKTVYLPFE